MKITRPVVGICAVLALAACTAADVDKAPPPTAAPGPSTEVVSLEAIAAETLGTLRGTVLLAVYEEGNTEAVVLRDAAQGPGLVPTDPWPTASLSKVFVAVAVVRLAEAGEIDLDAPIADYVDFEVPQAVTARLLLSHRAAVPETLLDRWPCGEVEAVDAVESAAGRAGAAGDIGTYTSYSNTGYAVLGRLVEAVTGQDPGAHIRTTIFEPLGMDSTYWYESEEAPHYTGSTDLVGLLGLEECEHLGTTVGVDGAAVTSGPDMDRFYRGVFEGGLVTAESLRLLTTPGDDVLGTPYGLGFAVVPVGDSGAVAYGWGGAGGTYGHVALFEPETSRTLLAFTTVGDSMTLLQQVYSWAEQNAEQ